MLTVRQRRSGKRLCWPRRRRWVDAVRGQVVAEALRVDAPLLRILVFGCL